MCSCLNWNTLSYSKQIFMAFQSWPSAAHHWKLLSLKMSVQLNCYLLQAGRLNTNPESNICVKQLKLFRRHVSPVIDELLMGCWITALCCSSQHYYSSVLWSCSVSVKWPCLSVTLYISLLPPPSLPPFPSLCFWISTSGSLQPAYEGFNVPFTGSMFGSCVSGVVVSFLVDTDKDVILY